MIKSFLQILLKNPYPELKSLGEVVEKGPRHIWIEPTNRCNTRCIHCRHYYSNFGQDMDLDLYRKIRDSALEQVEWVDLIGYGEPLLAEHFELMLDDLERRGLASSITTNGILLRDDRIMAKLARANMVLILSIDGARSETYEFVRPYIKWSKMLETLENIKRHAVEAGAEKRFRLQFNFVPMKQNIGDLPEMVRLAAKYGAEKIILLPLAGAEEHEETKGQSLEDCPEMALPPLEKALSLAADLRVNLVLSPFLRRIVEDGPSGNRVARSAAARLRRKFRLAGIYLRTKGWRRALTVARFGFGPKAKAGTRYCAMPWNETYFSSDGKVFPCCVMGAKLGDMNEQTWEEIWNGPLYKNLRRTIHSWNPTAVCRNCPLPSGISGGDGEQYGKFFSKYRAEAIALDSKDIDFGEGCYKVEILDDGSPSHIWLDRRAKFRLPAKPGAKFLRFFLVDMHGCFNAGHCSIQGATPEPFDNTCDDVVFPLASFVSKSIEVEIEMEETFRLAPDPRDLALAIRRIEYLS